MASACGKEASWEASIQLVCHLQVAKELAEKLPNVRLHVFSDRDLQPKRAQIEAALAGADVFFASLLFDYDQVEWLKSRVEKIPLRLVFESALELMSATQIGTFQVRLYCFALYCIAMQCHTI
jgi:magnesium chelatase subunit H